MKQMFKRHGQLMLAVVSVEHAYVIFCDSYGCIKHELFSYKNCKTYLITVQYIDCWYVIEPSHKKASLRRF